MERIKVGLTGLGLVLLLVCIAAAGLRPVRSVAPTLGVRETLSTMGVAPTQERSRPADPPAPAPARR